MLVYNNPMGSGSDLEPGLLATLAREVPAITAFKETSGDARRIAELVNLCPQVDVLVGGDDWALEGLCAGAVGWVSQWPTCCRLSPYGCSICAPPASSRAHGSCTPSCCRWRAWT
jgi:hypothetical protein